MYQDCLSESMCGIEDYACIGQNCSAEYCLNIPLFFPNFLFLFFVFLFFCFFCFFLFFLFFDFMKSTISIPVPRKLAATARRLNSMRTVPFLPLPLPLLLTLLLPLPIFLPQRVHALSRVHLELLSLGLPFLPLFLLLSWLCSCAVLAYSFRKLEDGYTFFFQFYFFVKY
jgi:hypothetical protein